MEQKGIKKRLSRLKRPTEYKSKEISILNWLSSANEKEIQNWLSDLLFDGEYKYIEPNLIPIFHDHPSLALTYITKNLDSISNKRLQNAINNLIDSLLPNENNYSQLYILIELVGNLRIVSSLEKLRKWAFDEIFLKQEFVSPEMHLNLLQVLFGFSTTEQTTEWDFQIIRKGLMQKEFSTLCYRKLCMINLSESYLLFPILIKKYWQDENNLLSLLFEQLISYGSIKSFLRNLPNMINQIEKFDSIEKKKDITLDFKNEVFIGNEKNIMLFPLADFFIESNIELELLKDRTAYLIWKKCPKEMMPFNFGTIIFSQEDWILLGELKEMLLDIFDNDLSEKYTLQSIRDEIDDNLKAAEG